MRKEKFKSDLKMLWRDFKVVYPGFLKSVRQHKVISFSALLILYFSFYADEFIRVQFSRMHSAFFDYIFSFGHWYGNGGPTLYLFILLFIGGTIFLKEKPRITGLLIGEAFVFSGIITLTVKSLFGRWRPYTNHGDASFFWLTFGPNDHLSLPSGHATVAFALSSVLAGTTNNIYLKIFYYMPAAITALSRIYHDQHWLSDVLLACAIGCLTGNILVKVYKLRLEGV